MVAAEAGEPLADGVGFDAFGDGPHAEVVGEVDDCADDGDRRTHGKAAIVRSTCLRGRVRQICVSPLATVAWLDTAGPDKLHNFSLPRDF